MFCRNCGQEIDDHAWVCTKCGVRVGQKDHNNNLIVKHCNQCGAAIKEYQAMCVKCGNIVRPDLQPQENVTNAVMIETSPTKLPQATPASPKPKSFWGLYKDSWHFRLQPPMSRRDFWLTWLGHFLVNLACLIILVLTLIILPILVSDNKNISATSAIFGGLFAIIFTIYLLVDGILMIFLQIRRLKDAGYPARTIINYLITTFVISLFIGLTNTCLLFYEELQLLCMIITIFFSMINLAYGIYIFVLLLEPTRKKNSYFQIFRS